MFQNHFQSKEGPKKPPQPYFEIMVGLDSKLLNTHSCMAAYSVLILQNAVLTGLLDFINKNGR
jgi:hypothetical protein